MKKAYVFPGQGAQFPGMGKSLFDSYELAKKRFQEANDILGFDISKIMFEGSAEELQQTKVTQPAVFLHSVIAAEVAENFSPDMVAGHSLGEFSALVANKTLSFADGLSLVSKRALAMQKACEKNPSTMAAILGLEDAVVEQICGEIDDVVVAANYNCPGQLVISGSNSGIEIACEKMKEAGAKRALPLKVGGAFHSPLMSPAQEELEEAIKNTEFKQPICPVYQNYDASPSSDIMVIKDKLIKQLTSPVRWTQTVQNMVADGASEFVEFGPGKVLQGLVKKIHREAEVSGME
ncbi:ACP S-malonyltransferase [Marinigracilibium pacificum]|uniref:Malonyl CoA-acyl carrier protein transacylase n=1 Tax=Marinigracilibium pacificum TaxID=2729599 RepID=A0A848J088_9BACT|nr:ACP S-malonyltransferase [Marinigracilibium pacificum]NMM50203.1 ACP S-malonyltransferase [Marinigracilibium pacificum]